MPVLQMTQRRPINGSGILSVFYNHEQLNPTMQVFHKELDKRFAVVHGKKITKKARIEATVLNNLTPLPKAEICKILPDISPTTVKAVPGAMVNKTDRLDTICAVYYGTGINLIYCTLPLPMTPTEENSLYISIYI